MLRPSSRQYTSESVAPRLDGTSAVRLVATESSCVLSVGRYRGALRRQRDLTQETAGKEDGSRLRCEFEANVVYNAHSQPADGQGHNTQLHDLRLGRAEDCCLACIAEPRCKSWSILAGLRYCQLSEAEVGAPGPGGQMLERTQSDSAVSGRLVRA